MKCVFKSKEDPDRLIHLKSRNVVKLYMQVPGVDFTGSFSSVATDTSTIILIGLTLFHKEEGWVAELCDVEEMFLHKFMLVEMFIEWNEEIVDLGIIRKDFLEEYCI